MKIDIRYLFMAVVVVCALRPAYGQGGEQTADMSFFLISVGPGDGGNLGGIEGADAHCQALAEAANAAGKIWHAYLSADADGQTDTVNARDRIGAGPWHNAKGFQIAKNLSDLHGDTLAEARNGNLISRFTALTEAGEMVNGELERPNKHDILTGTRLDGRAFNDGTDRTCGNWRSNTKGAAQVGHHDRTSISSISWVSAHPSRGCSQENLRSTGGDGLFYCFAID